LLDISEWLTLTHATRKSVKAKGKKTKRVDFAKKFTEQERSEALRESENRYRTLFEIANDAIFFLDGEGRFLDANRVACERLGYSPQELLKMSLKDINSPKAAVMIPQQIQSIREEGHAVFESRHVRRDGSSFPVEVSARAMMYNGKPALLGIVRDITDRKQAEDSASRLAAIVESSDDAIVGITLDGIVTSWNRGAERLYGYSAEEVRGKSAGVLVPPGRSDEFKQLVDGLKRGEPLMNFETQRMSKDGVTLDVSLTISPIKDPAGRVVGASATARDITQHKQMEQKLRENEENYRAIVENSSDMISIVQDGALKYVNNATCKRLGWTREEMTSPSFNLMEKLVAPVHRELVAKNWAKRMSGQPSLPYEITNITRDGVEFPVIVRAEPISYMGKPAEIVTVTDLTSEERARSLFDRMLDGVYRSTHEGRFVDVNPAFVKMFGYSSKQEMLEIPDIKKALYFSPEERGSHLLDTNQEEVKEYRMRRKDGSEIWVEDHGHYIHDEQGNILFHEGILRDITEHKRMEDRLRESEERYRSLFDRMLDGVYRSTHEGQFVDVNPAFVEMFRYSSRQEMLGIPNIGKALYASPEGRGEHLREKAEGGMEVFPMRRKDGSEIWVEDHCAYVYDKNGNILFHEGILRDITERKRMEEELRRTTQFLETIIQSADVWLDVIDNEGNMLVWNKAAESISGYSQAEVTGHKKIWEWLYPDEVYRKQIMESIPNPQQGLETRIKRKDGEERIISWDERRLIGENGNDVGFIVIGRDVTEQKRMEDEIKRYSQHLEELVKERTGRLAESESRLRLITDSLPALISYVDADLIYRFSNKAYEDWFGKPTNEIIGRHIREVLGEAIYQRTLPRLNAALSGKMQSHEYELPLPSGDVRNVSAAYVPDFEADGRVRGVFALATDVTDRKRAENALHESEHRYRELFEASPVSLWEEDFSEVKRYFGELRSGGVRDLRRYFTEHPEIVAKCASMVKVVNVNKATLGLYNAKSVEEMLGELGRVLTRESQAEVRFREELIALGEGKTRFVSEFDNQTLTGAIKPVSLILSVVPGYEETLGKVLVSVIDLTERKRMEEELQAATKRLEHMITSNPALVYLAKPLPDFSDYYTTYQSKSSVSMTGFESERFHGETGAAFWASRVHPDDLVPYRKETPKLWNEGHRTCEYRFLHRDGTYRWLREEAVVIPDAEGKPVEVAGCWIDVTDLKAMEERLHQAERLAVIGETAAMVGHDLRNPLQGITTATYLLRNESLTKEERNKMLQLIDDGVNYSNKIVSDLLDYSREIHPTVAAVALRELIKSALQTVKIPDTIQVRDQLQEQTLIAVDSGMMKRVLVNLIANAADSMPDGGDLTISSKQSDESVEITVSDTGTGLDKEVLANPWKPLQTTKAKGMGLGLPICKRIVDAHGGEISVESKTGEGTTFTIRLPTKPRSSP